MLGLEDEENGLCGGPCTKINESIKFLFLVSNTCYCFMAVALIIWTAYFTTTAWAELEGDTMTE